MSEDAQNYPENDGLIVTLLATAVAVIKYALMLVVMMMALWIGFRAVVPNAYNDVAPFTWMDKAVDYGERAIWGTLHLFSPPDYDMAVMDVNANDFAAIINKTRLEGRLLLVYVYGLDCVSCADHFMEVHDFFVNADVAKAQTLLLGYAEDKEALGKFLYQELVSDIPFTALVALPPEQLGINKLIRGLGVEILDRPLFFLVTPEGRLVRFQDEEIKTETIQKLVTKLGRQ